MSTLTQPDLNNLRRILDECEQFAQSIRSGARVAVADEILQIVAEARKNLQPSPDSTANYVESKQIIERLAALRERAGRTA
jgi:hypothetical protein